MAETEAPGGWERIKTAVRAVASFQADVVLTVFYYLALGPAALLLKVSGQDSFGLKERASAWRERPALAPEELLKEQG